MNSRLFRAVVGLGIGLGTVSAACLSGDDDSTEEPSIDIPATYPPAHEGGRTGDIDADRPADSAVDAVADSTVDAAPDASADAPKDVILDAFCDVAWPTTKGNVGAPTCGPVEDCAEAGRAPFCYRQVTGTRTTCDLEPPREATWCVGGRWQCASGAVSATECECFAGEPCPADPGP